jgi:hypothetical protein
MKINSKKFNFSFFLSNRKKVKSLENGAIENGGATQFDNGIYSNIPGSDYITVNSKLNRISLFIPSTMDVDSVTDNKEIISHCMRQLQGIYGNSPLKYYDTKGSWYSQDMGKVVVEDVTIMTMEVNSITEYDISNFVRLANYVKSAMRQEGVSITVNRALCIV